MTIELGCIAAVAVLWGGWPLVARSAGHGGPLGSLLLSAFGFVPIILLTVFDSGAARPSTAAVAKLAVAGSMMGAGLVAFNFVANSKMEASVSIPIIDSAMLVVTALGAIWFFGESVSPRKVIGILLLVSGIAVLRPS